MDRGEKIEVPRTFVIDKMVGQQKGKMSMRYRFKNLVAFKNLIGVDAVDLVKLPPGADWAVGTIQGAGTVILHNGMKMLQVPLCGLLLGIGRLPVPWQALLLSISIYVVLPLVAGYFTRKWIIKTKGKEWFNEKFLHLLTPVSIVALLFT